MGRPKLGNPLTPAERTARHREEVLKRGGRLLPAVLLDRDEAAKLDAIVRERNLTVSAVIRALILEA